MCVWSEDGRQLSGSWSNFYYHVINIWLLVLIMRTWHQQPPCHSVELLMTTYFTFGLRNSKYMKKSSLLYIRSVCGLDWTADRIKRFCGYIKEAFFCLFVVVFLKNFTQSSILFVVRFFVITAAMATHLIQICSLNKHTLFLTLKPQVPDWSIHICIFFRNMPQSSHLAVWQDGVVRRHTYFPKSFLSRLFWISENSQNMHISSFNTVFHCIYPFELWATKTNIKPGTRMLILNIITDF